jgi:hypothetical protein
MRERRGREDEGEKNDASLEGIIDKKMGRLLKQRGS